MTAELQFDLVESQLALYPDTRYMGSKQRLSTFILEVLQSIDFETSLDAMSGSGFVGYLMKAMGKQVTTNDYLEFCAEIARASIQNSSVTLDDEQVDMLCAPNPSAPDFIRRTFGGLYFREEDNSFLDTFSANLRGLSGAMASLARASIASACLKARARGVFTYTGLRYDDGRRDLRLDLEQQFREAVARWNAAVFDNGQSCRARHDDVFRTATRDFDLVYIDPPYVSPYSDNEYTRRYHFIEGLMSYWEKVEIQRETKTKKFPNLPTPFSSKRTVHQAFEKLIQRFPTSTIVISYSSSGIPSPHEIEQMLKMHRSRVDVYSQPIAYTFGTHSHRPKNGNNRVDEYLFVAHR